jgi:hypothetical protein
MFTMTSTEEDAMSTEPQDPGSPRPEPPNALTPQFLAWRGDEDEPLHAEEGWTSGPWKVETLPDGRYGVLREWESLAEGFTPAATFLDEEPARVLAALLPMAGRDPVVTLAEERAPDGFPVRDWTGESVGWLGTFDNEMAWTLHLGLCLVRSPRGMAEMLEAAGPLAEAQIGQIRYQAVKRRAAEAVAAVRPDDEDLLNGRE